MSVFYYILHVLGNIYKSSTLLELYLYSDKTLLFANNLLKY